jgi:hypothetical protein
MDAAQAIQEYKFCINCKHVATVGSRDSSLFSCMSPNNPSTLNLVDGKKEYAVKFCAIHRTGQIAGRCGLEGTWYEFYDRTLIPDQIENPVIVGRKQLDIGM